MKHTHTPGPWKVDTAIVRDSRGDSIIQCLATRDGSAFANAALIAEAPAMYEALQRAADRLHVLIESDTDHGYEPSADDVAAWTEARAILARIEGGQS